ncbi:hypothetical protein HB991_20425 [Yersinia mollaretii]|uniref:Uncharacterized protein n=1 Tax=Yersinia mollaretii TaxID=33060 RepID=A0AA44CQ37_YERMO|nr:hypothetical protein [Yersinia mollaretii]NIL24863.1 hypothetical protein [Yersinia mollaretii]CNJ47563.1 Uncharacterised protein [Yersinia mollaretii]CQQ96362.1 Uncharacterised protein [Yersinia mollaretii]
MRPIYNTTIQPVISSNFIRKENKVIKPSINIDSIKNTPIRLNRYGGVCLDVLSKKSSTEAGNINATKNKENRPKSDNYSTLNKQGTLFKGIFQNNLPSKPDSIKSRFTNIKNSDTKTQYDIQRSDKKVQINENQDLEWDYNNNILGSIEYRSIDINRYEERYLDALSKKSFTADSMTGFEEDNDIYIIGDKENKIEIWAFSNSDTESNSKDIKQDELLSSEHLNKKLDESEPLNKNLNIKMNHDYYTITVNLD